MRERPMPSGGSIGTTATTDGTVMARKILIIDDDADLSAIVCDMLTDHGYAVSMCKSLAEAYKFLAAESFHLIILDINLPDGEGFSLCEELRRASAVPIIFVSARTSETDQVTGLDLGADDYVEKPFSLQVLMSKVNSLMRRAYGGSVARQMILYSDDGTEICIDTGSREVMRGGEPVKLAAREYDLLLYMAEHQDETLTKERLLSEVWSAFSEVEVQTLTVHVRWLREKLETDPSNPRLIRTVWGVGYRMENYKGSLS